jgi:hypothetical protein
LSQFFYIKEPEEALFLDICKSYMLNILYKEGVKSRGRKTIALSSSVGYEG